MSTGASVVGVGLRKRYADELLQISQGALDFLEITPENWLFFGGTRERTWQALAEKWPTYSHSVSLSVGGLDAYDPPLLDALSRLHARTHAPFFSDHLCYSSIDGKPTHDLLPLPFDEETAVHVVARIVELEQRVGLPFLIENATYYARMRGSTWSETEFIATILRESGCGMLLDVNNVYVNAKNHGEDPRAFIDAMPMQQVRQMHVAGHTLEDGVIIDTHIGPVIDDVWALYRYATTRAGRAVPTTIEWDQEIPELAVVMRDVERARAEQKAALL
jgi:uncharacterized protein (UPF0276 family)